MAEDGEGGIWIASTLGLFRVYKGRLQKMLDGPAWEGITPVTEDVLLANILEASGNAGNLMRITGDHGQWKAEALLRGLGPVRLSVDGAGHILYRCEGGFCELSAAEVERWHPGETLAVTRHAMPTRTNYSMAESVVVRDRFGCVWIHGSFDASYQCPGDPSATTLPTNVAGTDNNPAILQLNDGTMLIPSSDKLAIGRPGRFRVLSVANGYPSLGGICLTEEGSILFGNANGLYLLDPRLSMEFWSELDGLHGNTWSILGTASQIFALAGESIEVLDADRSRWRSLATVNAAAHMIAGPDGTLLVASRSAGVVQLDSRGRVVRQSAPAEIRALARTADGQFWAAGSSISQVVFSGNRLKLDSSGTPSRQLYESSLESDTQGNLWACYAGGLARRDRAGWHSLPTPDGLLKYGCRSLAVDRQGDVWYGYDGPAITLIRNPETSNPQFSHFQASEQVAITHSNFFASDSRGWLWRGTPDGVYVADLAEARQGRWLLLNRADGLPAVDANHEAFFNDPDGSVWFGADNDVIHISPAGDFVHPVYSPPVFVSAFSWNGGPPQMADLEAGFKAGSNIVAYVGSPNFDRRNALRIRYRVLPDQPSWRETSSLDLALGKVAWGSHTIEVQGRIFTGPWSGTASRSFIVLRPAGLTWPFGLAYLFIATLLAAGVYWWRRQRQAEEAELLPNLAAWRLGALLPEVHALTGTLLNSRFEVGELLARGGFANVMAGYDLKQKQRCAIKIFRSEVKDKAWVQRRFEHEVTALQQVRHPNVVRIYAHGVTPAGSPYLVMEFVEGRSLREVLEGGSLPPERVARLLLQLAGALDAIHRQNIWHRDVKPENVMLRNEGFDEEAVLIDFSIAIVKSADETLHGLSRAAGTFDYMAPEQAVGYAQASSDIYSLAKLAIEMLTGRRLADLLPDAALDLPQRVRELLRDLKAGLSESSVESLASALEFDPNKRPGAAGAFVAGLAVDLGSSAQVGS